MENGSKWVENSLRRNKMIWEEGKCSKKSENGLRRVKMVQNELKMV